MQNVFQQQQQGQAVLADVPAQFAPVNGTDYRIVSVANGSRALTVSKENRLTLGDYVGDGSQKFRVFQNGAKVAFVVQSTGTGLCVSSDSKDNGADFLADPGQHPSSWFEVVKNAQGQYPNKGYAIKTHAGKALDGDSLANGAKVHQWDSHNGPNQTWLIVPASQPTFNTEPILPSDPQQQQGFFPNFSPPQFTGVMHQWGQPV